MQTELHTAGQHIILGLADTKLSDLDKKLIEAIQPRGVLLLKRNFLQDVEYAKWSEIWAQMLSDIRARISHSDLIVSIDHEGGRVHRLPEPITKFPAPRYFREHSYDVGVAMAKELTSLGINVSWSPCADVNSNPKNPVIGERAFGNTPDYVARHACQFAAGLEFGGLIGCAKHFPGHGDTDVDSHFALPTVNRNLADIIKTELVPFQALIHQGISCVMTAHILFPQIDPSNPATLSQKILGEILRQQLGFQGVIVSDDMDMLAVRPLVEKSQALGGALAAGLDLFILARHPTCDDTRPLQVAKNLADAINSNPEYNQKSLERIKNYISQRILSPTVMQLDQSTLDKHKQLAQSLFSPQALEKSE